MIPKNIFQSWYTLNLHPEVQNVINKIKELNPEYNHKIYTDDEIDKFVNENFQGEIADAYNKLNHIVAKVDFWRYLILYKYGGVYLDMDSSILVSLDSFIRDVDDAIITAEKNPEFYVQWGLIFNKNHPVLKKTIEFIIENINNKYGLDDIAKMTGPWIYSKAINAVHQELFGFKFEHSSITKDTNIVFENEGVLMRYFSFDYNDYLSFKCGICDFLYENKTHWKKSNIPLLKD